MFECLFTDNHLLCPEAGGHSEGPLPLTHEMETVSVELSCGSSGRFNLQKCNWGPTYCGQQEQATQVALTRRPVCGGLSGHRCTSVTLVKGESQRVEASCAVHLICVLPRRVFSVRSELNSKFVNINL